MSYGKRIKLVLSKSGRSVLVFVDGVYRGALSIRSLKKAMKGELNNVGAGKHSRGKWRYSIWFNRVKNNRSLFAINDKKDKGVLAFINAGQLSDLIGRNVRYVYSYFFKKRKRGGRKRGKR